MEQGYLHVPNNAAEKWKRIAKEFEQRWDFPHALGALDGKHVVIQAPARSGSIFFQLQKNTPYCIACSFLFTIQIYIGGYRRHW